ncbi:MAG: class I SAM-dependent methyltransferase [Ferruginibacter sp.]
MNIQSLKFLACPYTHQPLDIEVSKKKGEEIVKGSFKSKESGLVFLVEDGVPDFTYPAQLIGSDKDFNKKYEENARLYNEGMDWLFSSFFENEDDVRNKLISYLNIKPNHFILNMGCGTGGDSTYILRRLGLKGKLFNLDLTRGLLNIARKTLRNSTTPSEYFVGNGAYLPFKDKTFDSVFHFGGINEFTEKKKAINEMVRVVKPGGRVVFGDESVSPWLAGKPFGKMIKNANPLYKHKPPLHLLPDNAQNVSLNYVLGNSFYIIAFNIGHTSALNLDLPIPGKRGGTLRSRYEQRSNQQ